MANIAPVHLMRWIDENKGNNLALSEPELTELTERLEFGLLVAVLQNRLARVLREWRQVEEPLGATPSVVGGQHRGPRISAAPVEHLDSLPLRRPCYSGRMLDPWAEVFS